MILATLVLASHSFGYYLARIGGCAAVDYATTQWAISNGSHEAGLWKDQGAHATAKVVGSAGTAWISFSLDRRRRHGSAKVVMLSTCGVFLSAAAWNTVQATK